MRANPIKKMIKEGGVVVGTAIWESRQPSIAAMMAAAGFDFIFIDMEHTSFSSETVADMIRVARASGVAPVVRASDLSYHLVTRPLDWGAMGLMVPRMETRQQLEDLVRYTRYPPMGGRGISTSSAHSDYESVEAVEFIQHLNEENLILAQVESAKGVENIEEMVSVPGVDVIFVGPNDLSLSLGLSGQTKHPEVTSRIDRVIKAAQARGVATGIHVGNVPDAIPWIEKGMQFITISTEARMIMSASKAIVSEMRSFLEKRKSSST